MRERAESFGAWLVARRTALALGVAAVALVAAFTSGGKHLWPSDWDWVAGGTLALAIATVVLIIEQRSEASAARAESLRSVYRAAVLEQAENCRLWRRWDPKMGRPAVAQLADATARFEATRALLGQVTFPPAVTRTLVWLLGDVPHRVEDARRVAKSIGDNPDDARNSWWTAIDQLQALALLLVDHARTVPELAPVATSFDRRAMPWIEPVNARADAHEQRMRMEQAPAWPSGPAYDESSPAGRDQASDYLRSRQKEALARAQSFPGL